MELQCRICTYSYDLNKHLPKAIQCGHRFCRACLACLINTNYIVLCPMGCGVDLRDIDQITNYIPDIQYLQRSMLQGSDCNKDDYSKDYVHKK